MREIINRNPEIFNSQLYRIRCIGLLRYVLESQAITLIGFRFSLLSMFEELKQALEEVRDYRAGKRKDLRVTRFAPPAEICPKEVMRIRKSLRCSQREFALLLNTSVAGPFGAGSRALDAPKARPCWC
jgi:hypothetical protein